MKVSVKKRLVATAVSTSERLVVTLSPPPKELHPNVKAHWAVKARAVKAYRREAGYAALAEMRSVGLRGPWCGAVLEPHFFYDVLRRRDLDNLAASLKAARDGLQDACLVVNDSDIKNLDPVVVVDRTEVPRVELWLVESSPAA